MANKMLAMMLCLPVWTDNTTKLPGESWVSKKFNNDNNMYNFNSDLLFDINYDGLRGQEKKLSGWMLGNL